MDFDELTQIDLSKEEASPTQAFQATNRLLDGQAADDTGSGLSYAAASALTSQARLKSKLSASDSEDDGSVVLLEEDDTGEHASRNVSTLPPKDGGFGAWSYVASAFAMYIVVWGFPNAFPIFQTYLSTGDAPRFPNSVILAFLAPGINDIEEGIMFQFLPRFAQHPRLLVVAGITIILVAVFLSSISTMPWQIVLSQGVLFGIGGILLNFVHVAASRTWFDKKQSQAMGIVWAGWRFGALVFPLVCQWLLEKHGFVTTLRILMAPMLALLSPSVFLLRGRYPAAAVVSERVKPRISQLSLLRNPKVLYYLAVMAPFNMVAYVPQIFITRFGADMGLSVSDRAISHTLLVLSLMVGTYLIGKISDVGFQPRLVASEALITSAIHLILLGFCKNRIMLFSYAIGVGLSSGGFSNSFFAFYADVAQKDGELFATVHSLFSFIRGFASLSVGSVGVALIRISPPLDIGEYGIGKYKYLVIYAGAMAFLSGMLMLMRPKFEKH